MTKRIADCQPNLPPASSKKFISRSSQEDCGKVPGLSKHQSGAIRSIDNECRRDRRAGARRKPSIAFFVRARMRAWWSAGCSLVALIKFAFIFITLAIRSWATKSIRRNWRKIIPAKCCTLGSLGSDIHTQANGKLSQRLCQTISLTRCARSPGRSSSPLLDAKDQAANPHLFNIAPAAAGPIHLRAIDIGGSSSPLLDAKISRRSRICQSTAISTAALCLNPRCWINT